MPKFRNRHTRRVVEIHPEDPRVAQMDRTKRWERVTESKDGKQSAASAPKAADVRAWAHEQGVSVPAQGRLPDDVVAQYQAAQQDQ